MWLRWRLSPEMWCGCLHRILIRKGKEAEKIVGMVAENQLSPQGALADILFFLPDK